jgi:hypothetical protein
MEASIADKIYRDIVKIERAYLGVGVHRIGVFHLFRVHP